MQQGAENLIHKDKVMAIICLVIRVVDRVVLGPEDRPDLPVDVVVDVCGPDSSGKEEDLMRQEVHGAVHHDPGIRDGLKDPIDGMEGQASKG